MFNGQLVQTSGNYDKTTLIRAFNSNETEAHLEMNRKLNPRKLTQNPTSLKKFFRIKQLPRL